MHDLSLLPADGRMYGIGITMVRERFFTWARQPSLRVHAGTRRGHGCAAPGSRVRPSRGTPKHRRSWRAHTLRDHNLWAVAAYVTTRSGGGGDIRQARVAGAPRRAEGLPESPQEPSEPCRALAGGGRDVTLGVASSVVPGVVLGVVPGVVPGAPRTARRTTFRDRAPSRRTPDTVATGPLALTLGPREIFEHRFDQYTRYLDRVSIFLEIHSNVCLAQPFETNYRCLSGRTSREGPQ
ncbi:hypothetical protein GCM10012280_39350 [Wenjunlia tyrosinilytica]|uniref:Uncharacterized protein n=1 Tax=Wenjunlia tyrosinilytica TaxID=1544741 RepID=A0A917ZUX4_9ACTN|nr:hypothetical protein GCM10012280_39350 [Wenjunlia tyrosinilytica]